ncbi:hypothetical protein WBP06_09380 [Novosphingobium sp. BL-8H]|uniref:hypothetical protein n=1 Tax=Novosphingobium sp. BL-8H TaxID=3127640 RepID=UPI00375725D9
MPVNPWMKFYPQDWRADEKLRMCSLAARGLWVEMLALMHRSERYGQLLIGGRVPTDAQLAVQVGSSPSEVTALLAELDGAGVFSRAASGAIYSRRMTRDHKKAESARKNGKKGGNPALSSSDGKQKGNSGWDNQPDNPSDKGGDKPQKPEARDQKEPPTPLDDKSQGGGSGYAFSGKMIRLNQRDFDQWAKAFHAIPDIAAELTTLDTWLQTAAEAKQKNWFCTVSALLNRKHQEILANGGLPQRPGQAPAGSTSLLDHLIAKRRQQDEWAKNQGAAA